MKRYLHACALGTSLLFALGTIAQTPVWWRHFGNPRINRGMDLTVDYAGAIYGIGAAYSPSLDVNGIIATVRGDEDVLIAKWDSTGQIKWVKTAGGDYQFPNDADNGALIRFDPGSDHLIISGRYGSSPTYFDEHVLTGGTALNNETDMFVAAYDTAGHCLWAKGALGYRVFGQELLIDAGSVIHVFGTAETAGVSFQEDPVVLLPTGGFIAHYAANGTLLSAERVLTNGAIGDAQWLEDDWVIGGTAQNGAQIFGTPIPVSAASTDFVARTDTSGEVAWVTAFHSSQATDLWGVNVSSLGKILCSGYFAQDLIIGNNTLTGPPNLPNGFFAILDATGVVEHVVKLGSPTEVYVTDLKPAPDGGAYLFGQFSGSMDVGDTTFVSTASRDAFVARFNADAELIAVMHFGRAPSFDGAVLPTSSGLYVSCTYDSSMVVGDIQAPLSSKGWDIFLAKFDSLSGFTGIEEHRMAAGGELLIYANPNNGLCTIDLPTGLRDRTGLTLSIYDQEGRLVQRAPLTFTSGGVQLDIRAQAKGVYHVELSNSTQRYTGSIVFE